MGEKIYISAFSVSYESNKKNYAIRVQIQGSHIFIVGRKSWIRIILITW